MSRTCPVLSANTLSGTDRTNAYRHVRCPDVRPILKAVMEELLDAHITFQIMGQRQGNSSEENGDAPKRARTFNSFAFTIFAALPTNTRARGDGVLG